MTTKNLTFRSIAILILLVTVLLSACKKNNPDTVVPPPVQECFSDSYNGNYIGDGIVGNNPSFTGTLTLTKKGCQEAEIKVGNLIEKVTSLKASSGGGFIGTSASGATVNMTLTNNKDISVSLGTTIAFNGSK